ncbi:MAG: transglutaminase-like cysteine peptidase [Alphaproteobacteria bacterium]
MMRGPLRHFLGLLVVVALMAGPAFAGAPLLFGSQEKESSNLALFTQWANAAQRAISEKAKQMAACTDGKGPTCRYANWIKFLDGLKGTDEMEQIKAVNDFLNRAKYITDPDNYHVPDVWNSPSEFMDNMGDCEDYAIAKYFSLKHLGIPVERLRVVAVQDLNLKTGHAILAVYVGDHILILDNQIKQVVDAETIRHYQPVFSINEKSWWRHTK